MADTKAPTVTLEKIVSLCKRRGFAYASADIYSGINGVYDFGPLGCQLLRNIKDAWRAHMNSFPEEMVEMDGALLGPAATWAASGHLAGFSDPMIDCTSCKKRYRADDGSVDPKKNCPNCGNKAWTEARDFNLMFETNLGAMSDGSSKAYLRPETAQSIFINFKNVISSTRVKMPFGIGQIGKAFRNEITPKQFLFRVREFEQMELEFFCKAEDAPRYFEEWQQRQGNFYKKLGLRPENLRFRPHDADELAHYSTVCTDVEYQFPFGWKELEGIAHRGNFDLTQHTKHSGKDLHIFEQETNSTYTPEVIECSVGVGRLFFALLCDAYREETIEGDTRTVLKLAPALAPISIAVLPLVKKISAPAREVYNMLRAAGYRVQFDESGSIGKRYRRQDEIGTPLCVTFDFDSQDDNCVTIRDRDTLEQSRVSIEGLAAKVGKRLGS